MNEPDWATVLSVIYSEKSEIPALVTDDHILLNITGIDERSIKSSLKTLRRHGLIERRPSTTKAKIAEDRTDSYPDRDASYILTEKGFDVAHERELNRNQQRTNITLGILTIFLVLGSTLQGVSAYLTHNSFFDRLILISTMLIVLSLASLLFPFMTGQSRKEFLISFLHNLDPRNWSRPFFLQ